MSDNAAKSMVGKTYEFIKVLKIGGCKMQLGDIATILDYSYGNVSYTVTFKNSRLPRYKFTCGDWVIRQYAKEVI